MLLSQRSSSFVSLFFSNISTNELQFVANGSADAVAFKMLHVSPLPWCIKVAHTPRVPWTMPGREGREYRELARSKAIKASALAVDMTQRATERKKVIK